MDEVAAVPGIGPRTAAAIVEALADRPGRERAVSVNTATGEIISETEQTSEEG